MLLLSLLLCIGSIFNLYGNSETADMIKKARAEQSRIMEEKESTVLGSTIIHGNQNYYKTNDILHITSGGLLAVLLMVIYKTQALIPETSKQPNGISPRWVQLMTALRYVAAGYTTVIVPWSIWSLFSNVNNDYILKSSLDEYDKKYNDLKRSIGFLQANSHDEESIKLVADRYNKYAAHQQERSQEYVVLTKDASPSPAIKIEAVTPKPKAESAAPKVEPSPTKPDPVPKVEQPKPAPAQPKETPPAKVPAQSHSPKT